MHSQWALSPQDAQERHLALETILRELQRVATAGDSTFAKPDKEILISFKVKEGEANTGILHVCAEHLQGEDLKIILEKLLELKGLKEISSIVLVFADLDSISDMSFLHNLGAPSNMVNKIIELDISRRDKVPLSASLKNNLDENALESLFRTFPNLGIIRYGIGQEKKKSEVMEQTSRGSSSSRGKRRRLERLDSSGSVGSYSSFPDSTSIDSLGDDFQADLFRDLLRLKSLRVERGRQLGGLPSKLKKGKREYHLLIDLRTAQPARYLKEFQTLQEQAKNRVKALSFSCAQDNANSAAFSCGLAKRILSTFNTGILYLDVRGVTDQKLHGDICKLPRNKNVQLISSDIDYLYFVSSLSQSRLDGLSFVDTTLKITSSSEFFFDQEEPSYNSNREHMRRFMADDSFFCWNETVGDIFRHVPVQGYSTLPLTPIKLKHISSKPYSELPRWQQSGGYLRLDIGSGQYLEKLQSKLSTNPRALQKIKKLKLEISNREASLQGVEDAIVKLTQLFPDLEFLDIRELYPRDYDLERVNQTRKILVDAGLDPNVIVYISDKEKGHRKNVKTEFFNQYVFVQLKSREGIDNLFFSSKRKGVHLELDPKFMKTCRGREMLIREIGKTTLPLFLNLKIKEVNSDEVEVDSDDLSQFFEQLCLPSADPSSSSAASSSASSSLAGPSSSSATPPPTKLSSSILAKLKAIRLQGTCVGRVNIDAWGLKHLENLECLDLRDLDARLSKRTANSPNFKFQILRPTRTSRKHYLRLNKRLAEYVRGLKYRGHDPEKSRFLSKTPKDLLEEGEIRRELNPSLRYLVSRIPISELFYHGFMEKKSFGKGKDFKMVRDLIEDFPNLKVINISGFKNFDQSTLERLSNQLNPLRGRRVKLILRDWGLKYLTKSVVESIQRLVRYGYTNLDFGSSSFYDGIHVSYPSGFINFRSEPKKEDSEWFFSFKEENATTVQKRVGRSFRELNLASLQGVKKAAIHFSLAPYNHNKGKKLRKPDITVPVWGKYIFKNGGAKVEFKNELRTRNFDTALILNNSIELVNYSTSRASSSIN